MRLRIVLVLVDAEDDRQVVVGGRSRDDDLLDRPLEVGLGLGGVGEVAGGFDHNLGADRRPVELGGIALGEHLDFLAVDGDEIVTGGDVVMQVAKNGVVLEQMRQGCGRGQIVDCDEFEIGFAKRSAKNVAADAVDAYLHCHLNKVSSGGVRGKGRKQASAATRQCCTTFTVVDASTLGFGGTASLHSYCDRDVTCV